MKKGVYSCLEGSVEKPPNALEQQALTLREEILTPDHPDLASTFNNLAELYLEQAEALYQRALAMYERVLGPRHPDLALAMEKYADLLEQMQRNDEASLVREKAQAIQALYEQEF